MIFMEKHKKIININEIFKKTTTILEFYIILVSS
jgi:hypothetical protein